MDTIDMILTGHRPTVERERTPMLVAPATLARLRKLLWEPEMQGVGYSAFIERAVEVTETAIAQQRSQQG